MILKAGPRIEADDYIEAVIKAGDKYEVLGNLIDEIDYNEFDVCLN